MTVPSTTRRAGPYLGNGVTTSFPFTFKVFAKTDIALTLTNAAGLSTALVLDSDYSVTLNVDQDSNPGGSITYPLSGSPMAAGYKLVGVGAIPYDQTTSFPDGGAYRASTTEDAFDRTEFQIQQLAEEVGRALTLPPSAAADAMLPVPVASNIIGWDEAAQALVNYTPASLATVVVAGTSYFQAFNGTGSQTQFVLAADPGSVNALDIALNGVPQKNGIDFTVSGTTLTFVTAPSAGTQNIAVRYVAAVPVGSANAQDVTFRQAGTGAVARSVQDELREEIKVTQFGAKGDGITDDTAAFIAAVAAIPKFGAPGWRPCKLVIPAPPNKYILSGPISILGHQGLLIEGCGSQVEGNFAGHIFDFGDDSGLNDILRMHVRDLIFAQLSTAAGSGAVRARHLYESSFSCCYFYGGRIAYELDGNANVHTACTFRAGRDSNVKTGAASNNEANEFNGCSNEISYGYGYDLSVAAGVGGYTIIRGGYCEANASGNIYVTNACKVMVDGPYFNLQNNASAVKLGGTVGANYADPYVTVRNCRVLGSGTGTPKFIEELSTSSINARYSNNTLEADACDMYGSAQKSINESRRGYRVYVSNADTFTGTPPTGWTLVGAGPAAPNASSASPYGSGASVQITNASYIHQLLKFPANALLRITAWGLTTGADATMQMWDSALTGQFTGASAATASATSAKLEFYLTPAQRSSATQGRLLLRNVAGSGNAYFSGLDIEDMTN